MVPGCKIRAVFPLGPYSVPACMNEWYSRNMYAKGLEQNLYHEKPTAACMISAIRIFIP